MFVLEYKYLLLISLIDQITPRSVNFENIKPFLPMANLSAWKSSWNEHRWTGHLGCTDRASELHNIFPEEITQLNCHLIPSHIVLITPYKT